MGAPTFLKNVFLGFYFSFVYLCGDVCSRCVNLAVNSGKAEALYFRDPGIV